MIWMAPKSNESVLRIDLEGNGHREEKTMWLWRQRFQWHSYRSRNGNRPRSWKRQRMGSSQSIQRKCDLANTMHPDFWPSELWENTFLFSALLKADSLSSILESADPQKSIWESSWCSSSRKVLMQPHSLGTGSKPRGSSRSDHCGEVQGLGSAVHSASTVVWTAGAPGCWGYRHWGNTAFHGFPLERVGVHMGFFKALGCSVVEKPPSLYLSQTYLTI